jgi:hypothetical protein
MSKLLKKESLYLPLGADCSATAKKKIKLLQSINLSKNLNHKKHLYLQLGAGWSAKKKIKLLLSINLSKYQPF